MGKIRTSQFMRFSNSHSRAKLIAIATVVCSVIQGLLAQSGSSLFLFEPRRTLFFFELWRPFSSLFIAVSPIEVIFGALIIYSIGSMLESRWSTRRFISVTLGIPLIAEVVVLLFTLCSPSTFAGYEYPGSRQVVATLWITFGLVAHFSHEMLNFWGTPVRGKTFALIGVGFVLLTGVFSGFMLVVPELVTIAACYLYMYRHRLFRVRNKLELTFYEWKLRKLKKQTNLRVIKGNRAKPNTLSSEDSDDDGDNDTTHRIH